MAADQVDVVIGKAASLEELAAALAYAYELPVGDVAVENSYVLNVLEKVLSYDKNDKKIFATIIDVGGEFAWDMGWYVRTPGLETDTFKIAVRLSCFLDCEVLIADPQSTDLYSMFLINKHEPPKAFLVDEDDYDDRIYIVPNR